MDQLLKTASDFYGKLGALLREATDLPSRRALLSANYEVAELADRVGRKADALAMHHTVLAGREAVAREAAVMNQADVDVISLRVDVGKSRSEPLQMLRKTLVNVEANRLSGLRRGTGNPWAPGQRAPGSRPTPPARDGVCTGRHLHLARPKPTGRPKRLCGPARPVRVIFAKQVTAADPASNRSVFSLALTHFHMGGQLREMNRAGEARAAFEAARAAWQKLSESSPEYLRFRVQSALADCQGNIASILWESGKREEALAEVEAALVILKKLVEAFPADTVAKQSLARGQRDFGGLLRDTGKPAEALAAYEMALATMRRLAEANPDVVTFQSELASDRTNIAYLHKAMGKTAEALTAYEESVSILQRLSEAYPSMPDYQRELGRAHNLIGELLLGAGHLTEAGASFEKARAIHDRLVRRHPHVQDYGKGLSASLSKLGLVLQESGKPVRS